MFLHSSPSNDFQVLFSFLKDPFLRFYIMKVLLCSELSTVPDNFSCPKSQTNCLCQPSALLLCASLLNRVWLFVTPWTITTRLLSLQDFPGKNTGMDCHFLLWDLPDPGINRTPVSCVVCIAGGLSLLSYQGSPALFLALPFPPFSSVSILNFCSLISGCRMHVFLYLFWKQIQKISEISQFLQVLIWQYFNDLLLRSIATWYLLSWAFHLTDLLSLLKIKSFSLK